MIRCFFMMGILVIGAGCSAEREKCAFISRIDECVERLTTVGASSGGTLSALSREVESLEDARLRKACQERIEEQLLSADIRDLPYGRQADYLSFVLRFGYREDMGRRDMTEIEVWKMRLRVLARVRGELERLQPIKPINLVTADRKTVASYRKWRMCYNSVSGEYEKTLRWMEQALLPPTLDGMSASDQKTLTALVERFLGRKMRSVSECERDAASGRTAVFPPEHDMTRQPSELVDRGASTTSHPGLNRL